MDDLRRLGPAAVRAVARLDHLGDPVTFGFPRANALANTLADAVSFPTDQIRLVLCLFLAYPLALVFRVLPSPTLKHLVNVVIGVAMAQFVYGACWMHSLASSLVSYFLVRFLPVRTMPYVVFVANMLFLIVLHVARMTVNYKGWNMDSTASQMLLLIKVTSFAFNVSDGHRLESTQVASTDSKALARVKISRQRFMITKFPSLLEYLGFVFSFTTFLVGPAFEFREYIDAITGVKFVWQGTQRYVSSIKPALSKLAAGLFFTGLLVVCASFDDTRTVVQSNEPWLRKYPRLLLALLLVRSRYYTGWKLAEGSTVLAGIGFEGFDKNGKPKGWDAVSNIDVIGYEFAQSTRDLTRAWNKGTQAWLERYVYSRTNNSLVATYICSSIWHGLYPGYYFFFMTLPLVTYVGRLSRRKIRPYFLREDGSPTTIKPLYDIVGAVTTSCIVNYLVVSFNVLGWSDSIYGFRCMHYVGHIALTLAFVLLSILPAPKSSKAKQL